MAVITVTLVAFEGGNVRCELDYDDASLRALTIRQINNTTLQSDPRAVGTKLQSTDDPTKIFPVDGSFHRTPAGQTEETAIPPNVANQLPLRIVNLRGRSVVANLSAESQFPIA